MWVKNAIASVPFSASTTEALIQVLNKEFHKVVGAGNLKHWRSELLAPVDHKPGKPLMLRSFYNGKGNGLSPAEHAPKGGTLPPPP